MLVERALGGRAGRVKQIVVRPADNDGEDDVTLMPSRVSAADTADIIHRLRAVDGVLQIVEADAWASQCASLVARRLRRREGPLVGGPRVA